MHDIGLQRQPPQIDGRPSVHTRSNPAPLFLIVLCMLCSAVWGGAYADDTASLNRSFNVQSFGADGNGKVDDQLAIATALHAAEAWTSADPSRHASVYFPAGTYLVTKDLSPFAIDIVNARNLTIEGQDCRDAQGNYCTKIIGSPVTLDTKDKRPLSNSFFHVDHSDDITISNFYLDKAQLYFSQGTVERVNVPQHWVEIRTDAGYPDLSEPWIYALVGQLSFFTGSQRWTWDHSDLACGATTPPSPQDRSCPNFHILIRQKLAPDEWRLTLDRAPVEQFLNQRYLLWHNLGWSPGFLISYSRDVRLDNIFYTGGGGPGVHIQSNEGTISVQNFIVDVPPRSTRLFAATSGFNGSRNRATINLDHVRVAHTDDDAFHFADGSYYPVLGQSQDRRTVDVDLCYDKDFRPLDRIEVWNWSTKQPIASAVVLSTTMVRDSELRRFPRTCELAIDRPFPVLSFMRTYDNGNIGVETDANPRIVNLSMKSFLSVQNSYLSSMRARCGIIQVSALIAHDICQNVLLAGLLIGPEFSWGEGYAVSDVKIIDNLFDNVSGTAIYVADINDSARPREASELASVVRPKADFQRDNSNILIEGNTFSHLGTYGRGVMGIRGVAITVENASGVRILGNHIATVAHRDASSAIIVSPTTTDHIVVN